MENEKKEIEYAGYISSITVPIYEGGERKMKTYKLRCEVVEVYAMTCPKCGSPLELRYGSGTCGFCGTSYTTQFKLQES